MFASRISLIHDSAILILICLEVYLGVVQAPSSQTVGSILRTPHKCSRPEKWYTLKHIFLPNPPCKFANSSTILFANYHQIVFFWKSYFDCFYYHQHGILLTYPGKSYWRGSLSTTDLLVLTSLDQHFFMLKISINLFTKQPTLMWRSTVLSLPPQ